ncbi:MAG: cellulose synthase operon protein YhjQ/BcsQ [Planctomycetota bacterium]
MDWSHARRKLIHLARGGAALEAPAAAAAAGAEAQEMPIRLDGRVLPPDRGPPGAADPIGAVRAASISVASGKGGTGKSIVAASLANLLSIRGRTLLVDLDLGVGNAHILQDVSPPQSFVEVVEGSAALRNILVPCSGQVDLAPAGSGIPRLAELAPAEMHLVAAGIAEVERDYRYLVADAAAGVSPQTIGFAGACDVVLIVTTPDLTAMTDAYAFLKVILGRRPDARPLLLVNRVEGELEAREVASRISRVCRRFLGRLPRLVGWIPDDAMVRESVNRRRPLVLHAPEAPASRALKQAAVAVIEELHRTHPRGMGWTLLRQLASPFPRP